MDDVANDDSRRFHVGAGVVKNMKDCFDGSVRAQVDPDRPDQPPQEPPPRPPAGPPEPGDPPPTEVGDPIQLPPGRPPPIESAVR